MLTASTGLIGLAMLAAPACTYGEASADVANDEVRSTRMALGRSRGESSEWVSATPPSDPEGPEGVLGPPTTTRMATEAELRALEAAQYEEDRQAVIASSYPRRVGALDLVAEVEARGAPTLDDEGEIASTVLVVHQVLIGVAPEGEIVLTQRAPIGMHDEHVSAPGRRCVVFLRPTDERGAFRFWGPGSVLYQAADGRYASATEAGLSLADVARTVEVRP